MKKFLLLIITLSFCIVFSACGIKAKNSLMEKEIQNVNGKSKLVEISKKGRLTIDTIFQLANKKDALTLDDFNKFSNGKFIEGLITFEIDFRGIKYELQVSYDKADKSLCSVKLIHKKSSDSIDIRYDSIENFLRDHMSMSSYLTYKLPNSLVDDNFTFNLGNLGGNLFSLKKTGSSVAIESKSKSIPYGWDSYGGVEIYYKLNYTYDNGKLTDISIPWNHSGFLNQPEYIDGCDIDILLVKVSHDLYTHAEITNKAKQTSKYWYAFFAKEDKDISYSLFLNADIYTKREIIKLAKSVKFKNGAFDIKIQ